MKNKKLEANLSMAVSKVFSGLNVNALKFLLPLWMSPLTGATFRCTFAAVAFWVISCFMPPEKTTAKDKWLLFLLGALGLYGFMFLYLTGLSKTTPVSSSIFTSLQPIWVFLIMVFFYKEKATRKKIIGISIGLTGALVCILTQQSDDLASDAFLGNMLCLLSSVVYAVYLILSQRILTAIGAMTMLKYTFSGAAGIVHAFPLDAFPCADVRADFPDHFELYVTSCRIEIPENDGCCHLWLLDSDCRDRCFFDIGARPLQLDTDVCHPLYLHRGLPGGSGGKQGKQYKTGLKRFTSAV